MYCIFSFQLKETYTFQLQIGHDAVFHLQSNDVINDMFYVVSVYSDRFTTLKSSNDAELVQC